jgi:WD40 repeat protein
MLVDSICKTFYNGDEKGGLLTSFYRSAEDAPTELIIFELPGGKIRDRFPLVRCGENANVCEEFRSNWGQMMEQGPQWSPNGRYLAFAAVLDAATSDLFVYDAQDGSLRRLTSGPDWVGPIEWSPDGTQIIMQELLNNAGFFFDPLSKPPTSVWSVSVNSNEIKLLYTIEGAYAQQSILQWLDEKRFVAYEGFLFNADQARNLRLVDLQAGTNRILFDNIFGSASFDPVHETIALYTFDTEKYRQGTYLVSIKDSTILRLEGSESLSFPEWDEKTGLFVASENCPNDPNGFLAFTYQGNPTCVPELMPTPAPLEPAFYPAPNGKWKVSAKDGLWLEAEGQAAVQVSEEKVSDLIWCPDSSCLFFSVTQPDQQWTLYHVSLPDLTVKMVDEGIQSTGSYQWLGGEK